jgi:demethylmenaquinone methyltransferase / 2-methoxy-6-polyprenyl-1,4-benzoquinol methylase
VTSAPQSDVARMFDAISGVYDFLNHLLSAGFDRRWRRSVVGALGLTGRETVLDLCTGTADLALAAAGSPGAARRVLGIDLSEKMLRLGARKVSRRGHRTVVGLVRGDAASIPVRTASVDVVTVAFGLRNVERLSDALSDIHRTLLENGRLAVLEFSIPRGTVARSLYLWYFTRVLPVVGRAISRHASAYSYLPASVRDFLSPEDFATRLRSHGFTDVSAVPLTLGIVYLYMARKGRYGPHEGRDEPPRPAVADEPGCYNRASS